MVSGTVRYCTVNDADVAETIVIQNPTTEPTEPHLVNNIPGQVMYIALQVKVYRTKRL